MMQPYIRCEEEALLRDIAGLDRQVQENANPIDRPAKHAQSYMKQLLRHKKDALRLLRHRQEYLFLLLVMLTHHLFEAREDFYNLVPIPLSNSRRKAFQQVPYQVVFPAKGSGRRTLHIH